MAVVRPFFGLRYSRDVVGDIGQVLTPPFDVITPAEQARFYAQSSYNMIRLELGREQAGDSTEENKYTRAASFLQEWLAKGVLRREETPALYVYDQTFHLEDDSVSALDGTELRRRGLIAAVRLEEWDKRIILPHEETMAGPKVDRLALMRACRANLSPVFGLYEEPGGIAALLNEVTLAPPVVDTATPDGEHHRLWAISEPGALRQITQSLAPLPVYIADGHHRYETALAYRNERRRQEPDVPASAAFNYVMMVLVAMSDPGLVILPTHRLVQEAPGICLDHLESRLQTYFDVEARPLRAEGRQELSKALTEMARRGQQAPAFGVFGLEENTFHLLTLRDRAAVGGLMPAEHSQAWQRLDVSILHVAILQHLLGLPDVKGREDLTYTRDPISAWESVLEGRSRLAFFLNPTKAGEIRDVADADDRMPPKSTYFHPKLPTGLVINPLSVP